MTFLLDHLELIALGMASACAVITFFVERQIHRAHRRGDNR
jgi:hypothetical protein